MVNINIIAPNGYKIYFEISKERMEDWGKELVTLAHFDVKGITFDFRKGGELGSLSEAGTSPDS